MSEIENNSIKSMSIRRGLFTPNYDHIRRVIEEEHSSDSFKDRLLTFFHHDYFQHFLMFLLICDVIILFIEIFLSAEYPACNIIERNCISCCPVTSEQAQMSQQHETDDHYFRFLSDSEHAHHGTCLAGEETPDYQAFCDEHKYPNIHVAHVVLFSLSVTILSIFLIELNATLYAMGTKFFKNFFLVFDYIIVVLSLVFEVYYKLQQQQGKAIIAELLILFRLWRFIRVGHGIINSSMKKTATKNKKMKNRIKELTCLLLAHGIEIPPEMKHFEANEEKDLQEKVISQMSFEFKNSMNDKSMTSMKSERGVSFNTQLEDIKE